MAHSRTSPRSVSSAPESNIKSRDGATLPVLFVTISSLSYRASRQISVYQVRQVLNHSAKPVQTARRSQVRRRSAKPSSRSQGPDHVDAIRRITVQAAVPFRVVHRQVGSPAPTKSNR